MKDLVVLFGRKVLVKIPDIKESTEGGIIIPDVAKQDYYKSEWRQAICEVIGVGDKVSEVGVGDRVLVDNSVEMLGLDEGESRYGIVMMENIIFKLK